MTPWLTLRRLVWLLFIALVLFTVVGATAGGWAKTWLPNYAAEAAGVLVTVLVVERILERELDRRRRAEEEPLRRSAQQRLQLALAPLFVSLIHKYIGSDASVPLPAPINDPDEFLRIVEHRITTVRRDAGTWIGSWIVQVDDSGPGFVREVEEAAPRLQAVLDGASRVLEPRQEAVIEQFLIWHATSGRFSPRAIAVMEWKPDDPLAPTIDEVIDRYLTDLFAHLRALVALHDELGDRLSLADEWSSTIVEIKLIRAILEGKEDEPA